MANTVSFICIAFAQRLRMRMSISENSGSAWLPDGLPVERIGSFSSARDARIWRHSVRVEDLDEETDLRRDDLGGAGYVPGAGV